MGTARRGAAVLKLAVFGAGYVGLSFAACMAEAGHAVLCADTDAPRIAGLRAGRMPLHEPGLGALVARETAAGRLRFTDDAGEAARHGDILFIVVNSPADAAGAVDLAAVFEVARAVGHHSGRDGLLVCKSTLPVGTADRVEAMVRDALARRGATHRIRWRSTPSSCAKARRCATAARPTASWSGPQMPMRSRCWPSSIGRSCATPSANGW